MEIRPRRSAGRRRDVEPEFELEARFYRSPPRGCASLREFEEACVERVRALKALERASLAGGARRLSSEWRARLLDELERDGLRDFARTCSCRGNERDRRRDRLSHFALRLAYCRTDELRRWFVAREVELFETRFLALRPEDARRLLVEERLGFEPISSEERREARAELRDATEYYRVRFVDALESVRARRVYVRDGFAYVPSEELVSVLAAKFRSSVSRALATAARRLPRLEADARLAPLLSGLHHSYKDDGLSSRDADARLAPEAVDALAVDSFPPCMRRLHDAFRSAHHLKHGARLQYGLFLKAAGMRKDDAMNFWREEFAKNVGGKDFDKNYAYNIQHAYGETGGRKNYSAYGCTKIITQSIGSGDSHGCPFRHFDSKALQSRLSAYGLGALDVAEVADLAAKGQCQMACSKYFDITHRTKIGLVVNHPNQYLRTSLNVRSGNMKFPDHTSSEAQYFDASQCSVASSAVSHQIENDEFDETISQLDLLS